MNQSYLLKEPSLEILQSALSRMQWARQFLSEESRWCKGRYYADDNYNSVEPEVATKMCMAGALYFTPSGIGFDVMACLLINLCGTNISAFNDRPSTTHKDVLEKLDQAIALVQEELLARKGAIS